ncbi:MAG: hypothetical protein HQ509_03735 [Candidatus Marinimicrobia bacterium]|nr:hypothetical protein [Candidatus Neomarinimicrobiota bacterium]
MKKSIFVLLAIVLLVVGCNSQENHDQNNIKVEGFQIYEGEISIWNFNDNEIVAGINSYNASNDLNGYLDKLFILQVESVPIEITNTKFIGVVKVSDETIILVDKNNNVKYTLTISEDEQFFGDNVILGYGIGQVTGEFSVDLFITNQNESFYQNMQEYYSVAYGIDIFNEVTIPTPVGCGTSSCSMTWTVGPVTYSCSVTCRDNFEAECSGNECRCVACSVSGEKEGGETNN